MQWALAAARVALAACPASAKNEAVSTSFQIDASHDGRTSLGPDFKPPFKVLWKTDLSGKKWGQTTSYPIIVDNTVYVASYVQNVGPGIYALDLKTGNLLWHHTVGTQPFVGAAYDSGRVFAIEEQGHLVAFDAHSGSQLWEYQFGGQVPIFLSPPAAGNGLVYQGGYTNGGTLTALDQVTGNVVWNAHDDNFSGDRTVPALGHGGVFVSYSCNYYKFDPLTGAQIFAVFEGGSGGGGTTPVLEGNRYWVRDRACLSDGRVLNAKTGKQTGSFNSFVVPVFWRGKRGEEFEIGRRWNDPYVYAYDTKNHDVPWLFAGDFAIEMAPIVIDDYVVLASDSGTIYFLDAKSGKTKSTLDIGSGVVFTEFGLTYPMTGLGAGDGVLVIPSVDSVVAVVPDIGGRHK
jgi:outer membrane protein assembly factor BamB